MWSKASPQKIFFSKRVSAKQRLFSKGKLVASRSELLFLGEVMITGKVKQTWRNVASQQSSRGARLIVN